LLVSFYKSGVWRIGDIAALLGVTDMCITSRASQLKLFDSTKAAPDDTDKQLSKAALRNQINITPDTLRHYRDAWLDAVAKNQKAGRSTIKKEIPTIYFWLRYHDKDWLNANLPKRLKYKGPSAKYSKEQDEEIASAIKSVVDGLLKSTDFPVRVTGYLIKRKSHIDITEKTFERRFPLSFETLVKVVENLEDYCRRKIKWASVAYKQEGVRPTFKQLTNRSRLAPLTVKMPRIKDAINNALHEIDEFLNHRRNFLTFS
jgi:hypothetical protein